MTRRRAAFGQPWPEKHRLRFRCLRRLHKSGAANARIAAAPRAPKRLHNDQLLLGPNRVIEPLLGARQEEFAEVLATEHELPA
jgi:hypothetical protein